MGVPGTAVSGTAVSGTAVAEYETRGALSVDPVLARFVETDVLPRVQLDPATFWHSLATVVETMTPRNNDLLAVREHLQERIDEWHRDHPGESDTPAYRRFLTDIGYVVPVGRRFTIATSGVDDEIVRLAGPQLVVPASNARYALNAANARWGSLYDAVYGTDVLGSSPEPGAYDPVRGASVVEWVRRFLDDVVPLDGGSHSGAIAYHASGRTLAVEQVDGTFAVLRTPSSFVGYTGQPGRPDALYLCNNGLRIELSFDVSSPVGRADRAGVSDVRLESALTTIVDFEDSVAAVDAQDKVGAYRTWLGLLAGDLSETVVKNGMEFERTLASDIEITTPDGESSCLRGRSILLARNVGLLMTTPAVLDAAGEPIYEGLLDAVMTTVIGLLDVGRGTGADRGRSRNSKTGSLYVVKPKMHGPDEVRFASETFDLVESLLGLPPDTVKLGVMDEERRTSVNLRECIRAASRRIMFVNTGFLDRTGDEIHTSMEAGVMPRKADMKSRTWIGAYENWNVDTALACGFRGRAQIGKGMWAAPDLMADMVETKIDHPRSGASCAWVPSPTAATLHATHYHRVDVAARQAHLEAGGPRACIDQLTTVPVQREIGWSAAEIDREVENNAQGILGYVVRWVDQGVGCSKVPDIDGVGLMEDRATCRISSQLLANWLRHGVVSADRVDQALRSAATLVDAQNAHDPGYIPMAPHFDGEAFAAARALVFDGAQQPSGYTEPLLHAFRTTVKNKRTD